MNPRDQKLSSTERDKSEFQRNSQSLSRPETTSDQNWTYRESRRAERSDDSADESNDANFDFDEDRILNNRSDSDSMTKNYPEFDSRKPI